MKKKDIIYCIILTYNAEHWIKKCLQSVIGSTLVPNIIVIDNNSTDKTRKIITTDYSMVQLIKSKENLEFGKANNMVLQFAYNKGVDFFFLLNQDAWVEQSTIEKLVNRLNNDGSCGVLSPMQYYQPNVLDKRFKKYLGNQASKREVVPVRFVNAAIWMLARACVEKIGLFAPIFKHYEEDQKFVHCYTYHNLKVGADLETVGYHEKNQEENSKTNLTKLLKEDATFSLTFLLNIKHRLLRQYLFCVVQKFDKHIQVSFFATTE